MAAFVDFLRSSPALLVLCMGVSASLGLLHLWMARRRWDANFWIAVWSALACAFLAARGVQLTTSSPDAALLSGKVALAIGPYLVWAIVGFGRNLNGSDLGVRGNLLHACVSLVWTAAILGTPWFVEPEVGTRTDLFGEPHLAVETRWPTLLLAVYVFGILAWGARRLRRSQTLERRERVVLISGLGAYAFLGASSLLSGVSVIPIPAMAEYGPFTVAICLSYLLVNRRRSLEARLEDLLAEQTTRLAESEERYRDLVEHAPLGVFACDLDGTVTTRNRTAEALVASVGPERLDHAFAFPAFATSGLAETIRTAVQSGSVVRGEHRLVPSDGRALDWRVTASPLRGQAERVFGALVVIEDVTERTLLERQLRQAQKMESIGQLASGIAHEINNPMAFVRANLGALDKGYGDLCKLLRDPAIDEELREQVGEFESLISESMEGVERTIAIVRDMREFAYTGDEGRRRTDLREVLGACTRVATLSQRRPGRIVEAYGDDLMLEAASGPLRQVFLNLVVNALQAIDEAGSVWIEATREGDRIRVRVHDDGPGISDEAMDRLFDPFFTTKEVGEGTGLGLYISYQIVLSHGGDIRVRRGPAGGALFEVDLPASCDPL